MGTGVTPIYLITREQALTALTINCAKQMFIEDERGSISKGKYADHFCFFSRFLWLFEEFLLLLLSDNATS